MHFFRLRDIIGFHFSHISLLRGGKQTKQVVVISPHDGLQGGCMRKNPLEILAHVSPQGPVRRVPRDGYNDRNSDRPGPFHSTTIDSLSTRHKTSRIMSDPVAMRMCTSVIITVLGWWREFVCHAAGQVFYCGFLLVTNDHIAKLSSFGHSDPSRGNAHFTAHSLTEVMPRDHARVVRNWDEDFPWLLHGVYGVIGDSQRSTCRARHTVAYLWT
mmetsp:Transcript_33970/g.66119  ORF Transcript_33970/g.66119 Transcript_33970/m.66119 type:complete len:214 (+) Transcript_33970:464-1105(+)